MVLFLSVTALSLFLAWFCQNDRQVQMHMDPERKICLTGIRTRQEVLNIWLCAAIFLILTGLSACRIASGNDYWGYVDMFSLIYQNRTVSSEIGFNAVVYLMQEIFGKGQYLPIFGLFSVLTVFFFVKSIYDQGEWFVFSMFLFLMNGYYFSSFNSVRFYFVLGITMFSMKYVIRGEYGKFLLWILLAALFHKTVLVVIPAFLAAKWLASARLRWWHVMVGIVLVSSLFWARGFYREIIFRIYPFYENSQFDHVDYSVTNIAKCAGTLVLAGVSYKTAVKENLRNKFYLYLTIMGTILYTFGAFIPEVSRICYYLVVSQVFLIPNLLRSMGEGIWKKIFTAGVLLAFVLHFALFLKTSYSVDIRLLPYLNWIFN